MNSFWGQVFTRRVIQGIDYGGFELKLNFTAADVKKLAEQEFFYSALHKLDEDADQNPNRFGPDVDGKVNQSLVDDQKSENTTYKPIRTTAFVTKLIRMTYR